MEGPIARCAIVTALRDPLTQRVSRPNTLAAIGIKAGDEPVRFRFVTRPDKSPAAGYTLTARAVPDGLPHELGMTDRSGRIVLKPGFATRTGHPPARRRQRRADDRVPRHAGRELRRAGASPSTPSR